MSKKINIEKSFKEWFSGNEKEFNNIYYFYNPRIKNFLKKKFSTSKMIKYEDIEDATIDTFTRIIKYKKSLETKNKQTEINTYIFNIAKNLILRKIQMTESNKTLNASSLDNEDNYIMNDELKSEDDFNNFENDYILFIDKIKSAIEKLPKRYKETMTDIFINQKKIKEIAKEKNQTVQSIYYRFNQGKEIIKNKLQNDYDHVFLK